MDNRKIEEAFRVKYPDAMYQIKTISEIKDMFNPTNNTYIVEFVDTKMNNPIVLELKIKAYEVKVS